ncbi:hypothetical protein KsCSTR_37460 [Candidatus Kuenenia stuttgartiensis]|uniref:Uncharacterized protein n=1 Tax=Kuenenia stuttgartiensis TaxID=174633 RepID=Q1Q670_KUEST|nr:hypothetical protein KsCSTR_37460 [Candidatus Kuenenia stuttgartiensis]CAJ73075.1 unknown protein [Candidatus Kuenenia stuttgartiensis]
MQYQSFNESLTERNTSSNSKGSLITKSAFISLPGNEFDALRYPVITPITGFPAIVFIAFTIAHPDISGSPRYTARDQIHPFLEALTP